MAVQQPSGNKKLRLICSYGGQILPRPPTNSLSYIGGDTRIVSIDRRTVTTFSSLVSHLSSALSLNSPFSLKYRLPHLDLDSLITLASDDDFHILIDEYNRLSRIRLFLFPLIPHPKTEAWFFDDESMVLELSSSFRSASSSTSFTNLPPIFRPHAQDTFPSDNSVSSIVSTQQNISYQYQDPAVEAGLGAKSVEVETKISGNSSRIMANNTDMVDKGISSFPQFNQVERPYPHLQLVQAAPHFLPLHSNGRLQVPSCQLVYQAPRPMQHHLPYNHPNQPCPVYLVPVANISSNSCQASFNVNGSSVNYRVAQNAEVGAGSTLSNGLSSQNYNATTPCVSVPCNGSQRQEFDSYTMHPQSQNISVGVTSRESSKYGNELEDELSHAQIYKSLPSPPTVSSKHQTMTNDTTSLLSQALAQLHVDSLNQRTETSPPQ